MKETDEKKEVSGKELVSKHCSTMTEVKEENITKTISDKCNRVLQQRIL